jgi:hypothetical protein
MTKFIHNLISGIVCFGTLLLFAGTIILRGGSGGVMPPTNPCPDGYIMKNACVPVEQSMVEHGFVLCEDGSIAKQETDCKGVLNFPISIYTCPANIPIHIEDHDPGLRTQTVIPAVPPKYPHKRYIWCGYQVSKETEEHIKTLREPIAIKVCAENEWWNDELRRCEPVLEKRSTR